MIKFTALLGFTAKNVISALHRSAPNIKVSFAWDDETEATGELSILDYIPVAIGPEDIIIIPTEGDPIIVTRTEFYSLEVI